MSRARYERTPAATGSRNGSRSKRIQTAEGEISIAMPQVRGTVERFVSRVIPDVRRVVRTRPLEALVIGAYVRGLSDRDIESLLDEAGLGHLSKNTASQLRKRFRSSNLLERSLEEVRRRTKVIGRFPAETSCLSLCWAVLDLVIDGAHGLGLSPTFCE